MTRIFLTLPLDCLEPGSDLDPRRPGVLVAPLAGTHPTRYAVIGGQAAYWQAVQEGATDLLCEVTISTRR